MRILFFGLPGSGKTTVAQELVKLLPSADHLNADAIRKLYNDWDFSLEGRLRQAKRMRERADELLQHEIVPRRYVIVDFVAPLPEYRKVFGAHLAVFMDTIEAGRFDDTNKLFVRPDPSEYDLVFKEWRDPVEMAKDVEAWLKQISSNSIINNRI